MFRDMSAVKTKRTEFRLVAYSRRAFVSGNMALAAWLLTNSEGDC
jgi:hypothetical protein